MEGICAACAPDLCQFPHSLACVPQQDRWPFRMGNMACPDGAMKCTHSCTNPSYALLDLFALVLPIVLMAAIPPSPFSSSRKLFSQVAVWVPVCTSIVAFVFSTAWDNIIASQGPPSDFLMPHSDERDASHVYTRSARRVKGPARSPVL